MIEEEKQTHDTENVGQEPAQQDQEIHTAGLAEVPDVPNMNFNRKFRRMLLKRSGYVKIKNNLTYNDWFDNIRNNIQNGKQLHVSNTEDVIKNSVSRIDSINESTAKFLSEKGYTEETVASILEKNIQVQEKIASKKLKP